VVFVILDGSALSKKKKDDYTARVSSLRAMLGRAPALHVVLVGDDPASHVYVGHKEKLCKAVGVTSEIHRLASNTSTEDLKSLILKLNEDQSVDGVLVQLPLPEKLKNFDPLMFIDPKKDVDGLSPVNMGLMIKGAAYAEPCTPKGIITLLKANNIQIEGLRACVVGRSETVGWPMAWMLTRENATVTVCHSKTKDLAEVLKNCDLVVAAVGRPEFIHASMLKAGAIIVDVGVHRKPDGRLVGDVKNEGLKEKGIVWSPVPGGVGPMTVSTLIENLLCLVEKRKQFNNLENV
jgi:methylenetetrahydrofolate dehydrogenase (NADP+)/methenyltetrahydrofolate cyclohydrolase